MIPEVGKLTALAGNSFQYAPLRDSEEYRLSGSSKNSELESCFEHTLRAASGLEAKIFGCLNI